MSYSVAVKRMHPIIPTVVCLAIVLVPQILLAQDIDPESTVRPDFREDMITCAVGSLFRLIEGSFGALIMVVAGIGAIIAASMGAYRAAVGMLVVAVGSFILRALVSLFFGAGYTECTFNG